MIYLGADHGGFEQKAKLKKYLESVGFQVADLGTHTSDPVDYPKIAKEVATKVLEDPYNRGILICRSGAGVCIAANKIHGILAAQAWDEGTARAARNDDNANVLCLAGDYTDYKLMEKMAKVFIDTSFDGAERRRRRLKQIVDIEKEN